MIKEHSYAVKINILSVCDPLNFFYFNCSTLLIASNLKCPLPAFEIKLNSTHTHFQIVYKQSIIIYNNHPWLCACVQSMSRNNSIVYKNESYPKKSSTDFESVLRVVLIHYVYE